MGEYLDRLHIEAQEARTEAQRLFDAYGRTPDNAALKFFAASNQRHAEDLQDLLNAYRAWMHSPQEQCVGN